MTSDSASHAEAIDLVSVNKGSYAYSQEKGLDGAAVLELDAFICREACNVMNAYPIHSVDLADLVQEGRIGALGAAKQFDAGRGLKFITYAAFAIKAAMREAIGKGTIRTPRGKKNIPVDFLDAPMLANLEISDLADPFLELERQDLLKKVLVLVRQLPERKAAVLLRFSKGETLAEIADDMGFTRQRAAQILKECGTKICSSLAA